MKAKKSYRFEYQHYDEFGTPEDWGWDILEAENYRSAKKWIVNYVKEMGEGWVINYIAEIKYERED